jgi:hypothetical protein
MARKSKTFDCVEMKNRIQGEVLAEYEARKDEFTSFAEFLKATESDWEREVREGIRATQVRR